MSSGPFARIGSRPTANRFMSGGVDPRAHGEDERRRWGSQVRNGSIYVILGLQQALPVCPRLRIYRCVAVNVERGQTQTKCVAQEGLFNHIVGAKQN